MKLTPHVGNRKTFHNSGQVNLTNVGLGNASLHYDFTKVCQVVLGPATLIGATPAPLGLCLSIVLKIYIIFFLVHHSKN
jgi:hypothetical protein